MPGGRIYADSSLIERKVLRDDVKTCYIPATSLASEKGLEGLANMIIAGKILADNGEYTVDTIEKALAKCISARHQDLLEFNRNALKLGSEI